MPDYGLTETGFRPKRLADIIADIDARLSAITDPISGETISIDATDSTLLAQIRGIIAEQIAAGWQATYMAAQQFDPLYNTGAGQSATVQLNGIVRRPDTATRLNVVLYGTAGTEIPSGALITTADRKYSFSIDALATVAGGGSVAATATCTTKGAVTVADDAPMLIATPSTGWTNATNDSTAVQGQAAETDEELRTRQQIATSTTGYRQVEAIYAGVLAVPGVTYCRVYQNDTMSDGADIPAKSIAVVVLGGVDADVAAAIFLRTPVGIGYYGGTTISVDDSQGTAYDVKFQRPTPVPVTIEVQVTAVDSSWPGDSLGCAAIAAALAAYSKNPGESIYQTQLYSAINTVPGQRVTSLEINGSASVPVDVAWDEIATFDPNDITVEMSGA
jgi:uncharacterized phage protein gp47/JayE